MDGIIVIDKPQDFTSFDVVAKMRGILRTRKIGHAGTLDPMATGVLPLLIGRATKACDILPDQRKRYTASFRLGLTTNTQDITGEVLTTSPVNVSHRQAEAAIMAMQGDILQIPPMYSAIKIKGKRLYDLARSGIEVEREARPITIEDIRLISCDGNDYSIDVLCSKGTYIRTLCHDIGQALGCGATMTALRRTMAAGIPLEAALTIEQVQKLADSGEIAGHVLSTEALFSCLEAVRLDSKRALLFRNGVPITLAACAGRFSVYSPNGFIGVAATGDDGAVASRTLFALEV